MSRILPATPRELATVLRDAAEQNRTVQLGGLFTKSAMGGPVSGDWTVSTAALNRVLKYEPRDLTLSVEAGVPYERIRALLAERGQMLPLDPPWAQDATIGGVIAANTCGSRRRLYGTARDSVIGMTIATAAGDLVNSGGMVVKNVAGLDIQKLIIGSYGTLAAIASVNFKISPLPVSSRTFLTQFDSAAGAVAARDLILSGLLQPVALDVISPGAAGFDAWALALRAQGSDRILQRYAMEIPAATAVDPARETAIWRSLDNFIPESLARFPEGAVLRVSHPMPALIELVRLPHAALLARSGSGVAWLAASSLEMTSECARLAAQKGWSVVVEAAAAPLPPEIRWPNPGDDFDTMRAVKSLFDPKGILNPGRLHGRI